LALTEALLCPQRAIAHFMKCIRRGLRAPALVISVPSSEPLADAFFAAPHTTHDTS
jgi:hypothetical protein